MKKNYDFSLVILLMVCIISPLKTISVDKSGDYEKGPKHVPAIVPNNVILTNASFINNTKKSIISDNGLRGVDTHGDNIYVCEFYSFNIDDPTNLFVIRTDNYQTMYGNFFVIAIDAIQSGLCTEMISYSNKGAGLILNGNDVYTSHVDDFVFDESISYSFYPLFINQIFDMGVVREQSFENS